VVGHGGGFGGSRRRSSSYQYFFEAHALVLGLERTSPIEQMPLGEAQQRLTGAGGVYSGSMYPPASHGEDLPFGDGSGC
jgi:hypothetical protein